MKAGKNDVCTRLCKHFQRRHLCGFADDVLADDVLDDVGIAVLAKRGNQGVEGFLISSHLIAPSTRAGLGDCLRSICQKVVDGSA